MFCGCLADIFFDFRGVLFGFGSFGVLGDYWVLGVLAFLGVCFAFWEFIGVSEFLGVCWVLGVYFVFWEFVLRFLGVFNFCAL